MRRWRLVVISLVVVLVGGGVVGGWVLVDHRRTQHRLAQQKVDYSAGLAASGRADCGHALPLLSAARRGGSTAVAARAVQERHTCEELQQMQARTAGQVPTAAVISWIGYLNDGPPKPYQVIARTAARAVLKSAPMSKTMTAPLCRQRLELASYRMLTTKRSDPLAAQFISACAAAQLTSDPQASYVLYDLLRKDFPKQAATRAGVAAFGRVVASQLTSAGVKAGARMTADPGTFSLGGKTRLVVTNGEIGSLDMILVGQKTRLISVKACKTCSKVGSTKQGLRQCDRKGATTTTVTLPAGRYAWANVGQKSVGGLWVEKWHLTANRRYSYCWWTDR